MKNKTYLVSSDWKDPDGLIKEIRKTLRKFGLHTYISPTIDGSDSIGFIISNTKFSSNKEADAKAYGLGLKEYKKEFWEG